MAAFLLTRRAFVPIPQLPVIVAKLAEMLFTVSKALTLCERPSVLAQPSGADANGDFNFAVVGVH